MKVFMRFTLLFPAAMVALFAQPPTAASLPTDRLLSESGPTFGIDAIRLPNPMTVIAYGDQRFTDPANTQQTNPRIRQWLVNQIAQEHPAAVIMNGDIPLAGNVANDYAVFQAETKPWRDLRLHVFP